MDDCEKRVLRRWKPLVCDHVTVTSELIALLKQAALLTEETMHHTIQAGDNEMTKTARIVDLVIACPERGSFAAFCDIIGAHHGWIARDMETDVRIEKGDVTIDEDILKETAMLVHRKFGTSKRLCEGDKRSIRDLMATKLQVVTDEWRLAATRLEGSLAAERAATAAHETRCRHLVTSLCEFLHEHEAQLTTHAHGMITTSDTLRRSLDDVRRDTLSRLQAGIGELLNQLARTLAQRDGLERERDKCQKLLSVEDAHEPLDVAVRRLLQRDDTAGEVRAASAERAREAKRLNSRLLDLEDALQEKEDLVKVLTARANGPAGCDVTDGAGGETSAKDA